MYLYSDHHVKFASGTHLDPEPIRVVDSEDPSLLPEAHVGILRNHHTYSADIPIPHSLGLQVSARHGQSNIHFTVMEVPKTVELESRPEEDGYKFISTVKVRAKAFMEGNLSERIEVYEDDVDGGGSRVVLLTAKVLKASQGNPLLRDGVHLLSHEHTDDSDFTEWPGFSKDGEDLEK